MDKLVPYTRLPRRFKALMIDSVFLSLGLFLVIYLVTSLHINSPTIEAITIFALIGSVEPLCITITGSSVGHHICGLRVRRVLRDSRLNLLLSYIRFITKICFGILSLISVLITRKHQALHDLMSNSIVVHKAPHLVPAYDVIPERIEDTEQYVYPSKIRRIFLILLYVLLVSILLGVVNVFLQSVSCLNGSFCSEADSIIDLVISLTFWISTFSLVWLGWQGRLYGCRRKSVKH